MLNLSGFLAEFYNEVNFVLTQEDHGNQMEEVLAPVKNLFLEEKSLLSFSLARYCGANTRISFFCEWYFQVLNITKDTNQLYLANQNYLRKKVPLRLRGLPNLYEVVDKHIENIFLPSQIGVMHSKNVELTNELKERYPYLSKYLNKDYLSKFIGGEIISIASIYREEITTSQYLKAQGQRLSFVQIALPCLLGLSYSFNQPNNPINPEKVKWVLLEEVLRDIATLYQIYHTEDLQRFLYLKSLSESEEFNYLKSQESTQSKLALQSNSTRQQANEYKDKILFNAINNLEALVFPDNYKEMIRDLIEWSSGSEVNSD